MNAVFGIESGLNPPHFQRSTSEARYLGLEAPG
jgi:hypothetical protein